MAAAELRHWHRLFGIALTDLFSDTPWCFELEKQLALAGQLLDVAIIARSGDDDPVLAADLGLPDGAAVVSGLCAGGTGNALHD